jgi:hypothetical protein
VGQRCRKTAAGIPPSRSHRDSVETRSHARVRAISSETLFRDVATRPGTDLITRALFSRR